MADVVVSPVKSGHDRKDFFNFPWDLYRDDPYWIPPLQRNQKQLLGWKYHPFQKIAEIQTFVARRGSTVCGRVAAILNHEHNRVHKENRGFFGFFECRDDQEAANALLDLGFGPGDMHRIAARCDVRNIASWRLMDRLGMRREAHFREHARFKNQWDEEFVYAILWQEWHSRREASNGG